MAATTKHKPKLQFEDFVVFFNFLKALLQHCSLELSLLTTATDLILLAEHAGIAKYKATVLEKNFAHRWRTLFEKCLTDSKFCSKSMKMEAHIIHNALSNRGDFLTNFNDFPASPTHDKVDMKRYHRELIALMKKNQKMYNENQKRFIDGCIFTTRANLATLTLYDYFTIGKNGDASCFKLEWENIPTSLKCIHSPSYNNTMVTDHMKLAQLSYVKYQKEADDHGKSMNAESSAKDQATETDSPVPEVTKVEQCPQVFQLAHTVNITYNIAGSMASESVNDEMQRIEKLQSPAPLPTPGVKRAVTFATNSASDSSPKRSRQTPAPEINEPTKFGKYAIFKQFLEALLKNFSSELSGFKTPSEMKAFLANQPTMKSFQEIFMSKNFVTQWKELHGKCDPIFTAPNTMATAAREIATGLAMKGSLIKHFADFPAKPQDNNVENLERCIGKIKIMLKKRPEYNINQMDYLRGFKSTLQRKLTNLHNLLDVIQPRSSKSEHAAPSAEAAIISQGSCLTSVAPVHDSLGSKSAKKSAIDYFIKENPNVPEADVYREFSFLEPEKRNRYVKMAEEASGNVN